MRVWALVVLLGAIPAPGLAQESAGDLPRAPDMPPGEDVLAAIGEGERAPYDGVVLDTDTAIRWTNRIGWYRHELRLTIDEWTARELATAASHDRELLLVRESYTREIDGLRTDLRASVVRYEAELARYRNPPFYETWGFAFGLGVLVTGIVVAVVGALVAGL